MSRVFTRGGGRSGSGIGNGNTNHSGSSNNASGYNRSRGNNSSSVAQREWKENEQAPSKEQSTSNATLSTSSFNPTQGSPQLEHKNVNPTASNYPNQHPRGQQPSRPLYQPKPRTNSDNKDSGTGQGSFGRFENSGPRGNDGGERGGGQGGRGGGLNRDGRDGRHRGGHYGPRDHNRNKPRQAPPTMGAQQKTDSRNQRAFDQVSSRETSSVETNENETDAFSVGRKGSVENVKFGDTENRNQRDVKGTNGGNFNRMPQENKREQGKDENTNPKPQNPTQSAKPSLGDSLYRSTFDSSFSKSIEQEPDSIGSFGTFKNGHMDNLLGHTSDFDQMGMYGSHKGGYYPMGINDMGPMDKLSDRGFNQSPHDGGDIFSKDVMWRGPEREAENRNIFGRNDTASPIIPKSMIWSNTATIPQSQPDPSHFRPLGTGFPMDHGGFSSNLLGSNPASLLDHGHMDMGMHQRLMQNMPPFLSNPMQDRMHGPGLGDRLPHMFGQPQVVHQPMSMNQPVRFHPQQTHFDSYVSTPLLRDQNRMPHHQAPMHMQQQQQPPPFMPPVMTGAPSPANKSATPKSPQVPEKNWTWEEQSEMVNTAPPAPEQPPKAPEEDFGEFHVPELQGPSSFENLRSLIDKVNEALQENLKMFIEKPHKERLRRVMVLCFTLWKRIREAILLDLVQSCAKKDELDRVVWREGVYPVVAALRSLNDKNGISENVGINEALKVFLGKASKFYTDLIPRVLHPFGGAVTSSILVNLFTSSKPVSEQTVASLNLAARLLVHLGDIYRYQSELPSADGSEIASAKDAYQKALLASPYDGRPCNQLVLVAKRQMQPLDAAYYAIRALSAKLPCQQAPALLQALLLSVEKTYEGKFGGEEKTPNWSHVSFPELNMRFKMLFLVMHAVMYQQKANVAALTTQGMSLLGILEALLNHPLSMNFRDVLIQMMAINIYRMGTIQGDVQIQLILVDLSFNMLDLILTRMLRTFENATDLDSAVHLEETSILAPVIKVFVEWMVKSPSQKWYPLANSQLSSPQNTKRTGMWSRLISLANLSLTLNVNGVHEERVAETAPGYLYEDLFLVGMSHVLPQFSVFYRDTKLHEAIAEPRYRFRKISTVGMTLLSLSPAVARLQYNRFLPNEGFEDKKVKILWAPLEPPPTQKMEPLPTMERVREVINVPQVINLPPERPATSGWNKAASSNVVAGEQNWPTIGQASRTDDRKDRLRTGSTHSISTDDGRPRQSDSVDMSRASVEPWWLIDQRLRNKDGPVQLKPLETGGGGQRQAYANESTKKYILLDTNCLIDYLDRIEKKLQEDDDLVFVVPGVVSRELWKLHEKKNMKAHAALSFISDAMEHSKGRLLLVTVKGELIPFARHAKNEIVAERGNNDDIILRTCSALGDKGLYNEDDKDRRPVPNATMSGCLILLTSDANMRVKARKENICCRMVNEVLG